MIFGKDISNTHPIKVKEKTLHPAGKVKYLGVIIDSKLQFSNHIDNVIKKVRSGSHLLGCNKAFLSPAARLCVYNSLINSHIEYCTEIWGNLGLNKDLQRLHIALKQGVRHVAKAGRLDHTGQLFKQYSLLKLRDTIELRNIKICQGWVDNTLPIAIKAFFTVRSIHRLRKNTVITHTQQSKLCNSISRNFNRLPRELRNQTDSKGGITKLFSNDKLANYENNCKKNCPSCKYKAENN